EALQENVMSILDAIKVTLENTPPELSADIVDRGIVLAGGGALLKGLDILIREQTGVPVIVAEDPLTAVVRGCGMMLDKLDLLKRIAIATN
ncbi:MAG: rod shape-determining protein, partial [Thermodesulfovibrionales bacterium]